MTDFAIGFPVAVVMGPHKGKQGEIHSHNEDSFNVRFPGNEVAYIPYHHLTPGEGLVTELPKPKKRYKK